MKVNLTSIVRRMPRNLSGGTQLVAVRRRDRGRVQRLARVHAALAQPAAGTPGSADKRPDRSGNHSTERDPLGDAFAAPFC